MFFPGNHEAKANESPRSPWKKIILKIEAGEERLNDYIFDISKTHSNQIHWQFSMLFPGDHEAEANESPRSPRKRVIKKIEASVVVLDPQLRYPPVHLNLPDILGGGVHGDTVLLGPGPRPMAQLGSAIQRFNICFLQNMLRQKFTVSESWTRPWQAFCCLSCQGEACVWRRRCAGHPAGWQNRLPSPAVIGHTLGPNLGLT